MYCEFCLIFSKKIHNSATKSHCIVIFINMDYKEIGKKIKERRKSLNITQPLLATLAGVGLNSLVAIERGNGNAKIHTILAILDTLGMKIEITLKD